MIKSINRIRATIGNHHIIPIKDITTIKTKDIIPTKVTTTDITRATTQHTIIRATITRATITMAINNSTIQTVHTLSSQIFNHQSIQIKMFKDQAIRIWDLLPLVSPSMLILMEIFSKLMSSLTFMMSHHHRNVNKSVNISANVNFLFGKLLRKTAIYITTSKTLNTTKMMTN